MTRFADEAGVSSLALATWRAGVGAIVVLLFLAAQTVAGRPSWRRWRDLPLRDRIVLALAAVTNAALNLAAFMAFPAHRRRPHAPDLLRLPGVRGPRERDLVRRAARSRAMGGAGHVDDRGRPGRRRGGGAGSHRRAGDRPGIGRRTGADLLRPGGKPLVPGGAGGAGGGLHHGRRRGHVPGNRPRLRTVGGPGRTGRQRRGAWPVLVAGVLGEGLPTVWFIRGIQLLGAPRATILATLEPVVGVGLAALLFGAVPSPVQLLGGALIIAAGIVLQLRPAGRSPSTRRWRRRRLLERTISGSSDSGRSPSPPAGPARGGRATPGNG